MVVELLDDILAFLLIPALILYLLHYGWFKKYVFVITQLVVYVSETVAGLIHGVILLTPKLAVGLLKTVLIAITSAVLVLVYSITYLVPYAGEKAKSWEEPLKDGMVASYFAIQVRKMRGIMVRIVAEEDDRNLDFKDAERYRAELAWVKQDAKNRLEAGETLLSILLGAVLLAAKLTGVKLLQVSIYGIPLDLLIEGWLLVIALSIIYRSSTLEFLAYSSDEGFDSLDAMDAALSYQKGISLVGFVQGLMFLLVFVAAISKVKYSLVEDALRARYTNEPWIAFTWEKLTD